MRIDWSPLFGYDIFISYRRGDGNGESSEYATALRTKLQKAEFQCFLDNDDAPVGESLNPSIRRGLRRSRAMVVLCTPASLNSVWVAEEVQYFPKKRNPAVIPVNFSGYLESLNLKETAFSPLVDLGTIWLNENNPREPSDSVLGGIQARFKYRRANTLRTWFLSVVAILLGIVAATALIQKRIADQQRAEATKQSSIAREQRDIARQNELEAVRQRNSADARYLASEGLRAIHERGAKIGLVLLVESLRLEQTPEATGALFTVMSDDPHLSMLRFSVPQPATTLAFSPSGDRVAAGQQNGGVFVRDLQAGLGTLDQNFAAGSESRHLTGGGSQIAFLTLLRNGSVRTLTTKGVWLEWGSSKAAAQRMRKIAANSRTAENEYLALSGDGGVAAVGDYTHPVVIWNADTDHFETIASESCYGDPIALTDDGGLLACGEASEHFTGVHILDLRTNKPQTTLPLPYLSYPVSMAFSFSGLFLAVGNDHGSVYVWPLKGTAKRPAVVIEHEPDVYTRLDAGKEVDIICFSPDGRLLATRYRRSIYIWHVASGELIAKLPGAPASALAFSSDSQRLAVADFSAGVRIWDLGVFSLTDWACRNADRNLTQEEWSRYIPDRPYHKTCVNW